MRWLAIISSPQLFFAKKNPIISHFCSLNFNSPKQWIYSARKWKFIKINLLILHICAINFAPNLNTLYQIYNIHIKRNSTANARFSTQTRAKFSPMRRVFSASNNQISFALIIRVKRIKRKKLIYKNRTQRTKTQILQKFIHFSCHFSPFW